MRSAASTARTCRSVARLPASTLGWVQLGTGVTAALVVLAAITYELLPILEHPHALGRREWDAMESHRYLVRKALARFHELPLWNPYACGGHPEWGAIDGDTVVVAPWLPAYLLLALPIAIRIEVVLSTLWGALGAWLLASRFTRSQAGRAFVAVLFVVNSRWTLQLAAGHAGHLVYAWMPWTLVFFDRAVGAAPDELGPPRPWAAVGAGACLAMMLYTGGFVPLTHTVVALTCYAALLAVTTRSPRPLGLLALAGLVGVGLAAPKLLPVLEVAARFPPPPDLPQALDPQKLMQVLTNPVQTFDESPAGIPAGSWPDAGMYIGWPALLVLGAGFVAGRGARVGPLKAIALGFFVLAIGSFTPYAPWALLHRLPVFARQPVPFAWLVPAVLLLTCVAVAAGEEALARTERARAALEIGLALAVGWMAKDLAATARQPLAGHLQSEGPSTPEAVGDFHREVKPPAKLATTLSAEMANIGTLECDTFEGLQGGVLEVGGHDGRPVRFGARGVGESGYHGETYLVAPTLSLGTSQSAPARGAARFVRWSPSSFDVRVEGAQPGAEVVINQNWDPGWSVDGAQALDYEGTLAARVGPPSRTLSFRYMPRTAWLGVAMFLMTLGALAVGARGTTRRRRR